MRAFDPDPRLRWLFCFTHPDDEIAICAWIRRLAMHGNDVHISWTHSTRVREAEARAAAHLLGVPPGNLHFFMATDGRVAEEMAELLPQFEKLMRQVRPDRVVCGAFEQGHIDHDATNMLVHHAFDGPIFEVPLYHTYLTRFQRLNRFADQHGQEVLQLDMFEQRLKTIIARQYPSQNIWSVLMWYQVWQRARFRPMLLTHSERMRLKTCENYLRPNLPEPLARRVRRHRLWRRWRACAKALRAHCAHKERDRHRVPLTGQKPLEKVASGSFPAIESGGTEGG